MSYIGRGVDAISSVDKLTNITFDGSTTYNLIKDSAAFTPSGANNILISIDGVVQSGNFSISNSQIIFDWSPTSNNTCNWIQHYGVGVLNTPADDTVSTGKLQNDSVTTDKLANSINSAITANTAKTGITSSQTSAITANTSKTTNATHSGEVTGATALTIADNIVDEANLKVSNSATNGHFLSAQSGNSGGLTWASAGGGKINQVLQTYKINAFSTTSTSYTGISGFNRAISPSATSSKILVNLVFSWGMAGSNTSWFQLARTIGGGSEVIIAENSEDGSENAIFGSGIWGTNGNYGLRSIALDFLDTTNTTSEVFYYMKMRADGGTTYLNRIGANTSRAGTSQITCMEVLA